LVDLSEARTLKKEFTLFKYYTDNYKMIQSLVGIAEENAFSGKEMTGYEMIIFR